MVRYLLRFKPDATAKRGLRPTTSMATPVFVLKNSQTEKAPRAKNNNRPVGIVTPKMVKERNSLSTPAKESAKVRVTRSPEPPMAQIMVGFLKSAKSQKIHIPATIEKPTYVPTIISCPTTRFRSCAYKNP